VWDVLQGPQFKYLLEVKRSQNGNSGFTFLQLGSIFVLSIGPNPLSPNSRRDLAKYERRNRKAQLYRREPDRREPGHTSPRSFPINRSAEEAYQ
jgi:hypothetical protein